MTDAEKIKAVRREYAKRYRSANREKVRAAQERYWLRKAEEMFGGKDERRGTDAPAGK